MTDLDLAWEMDGCVRCSKARHKISPTTGTFHNDQELEMLHVLWHREHPLLPAGDHQ